jgi:hypothetical protein
MGHDVVQVEPHPLATENGQLLTVLHHTQEALQHCLLVQREYQAKVQELASELHAASLFTQYRLGRLQKLTDWLGLTQNRHLHAIRTSPLFDAQWYLQQHPDVAQQGWDPAKHYLKHGAREGRNPSPRFDTRWYLTAYPDVAQKGMNPLVHYLWHGKAENRLPCPGGLQQADPFALERKWLQKTRDEQAQRAFQLQSALDAKQQENAALVEERDGLRAELDLQRQRNEVLEAEKFTLTRALTEARQGAESLQAQLEEARRQAEETREALENRLSEQAQRLAEEQGKVQALQRQQQEQAAALASREREIEALRQAQVQAQQRQAELEAQLGLERQRAALFEGQLAQYRQQAEQEQGRLAESFQALKAMLLHEAG